MKRRDFLKIAGATVVGLPLSLQGMEVGVLSNAALLEDLTGNTDKVLVLITMTGGNDGLNMLIPKDQYSNLAIHRPNIMIPEDQILDLTPETGLHPSMSALQQMFFEEEVAFVQAVGYPNPNRSHFRSTDIINSGSGANTYLKTGYLGRYLDTEINLGDNNLPSPTYPDPLAIVIGSRVSETCQGVISNYSQTISDPYNINPLATTIGGSPPPGYYADRLSHLQTTIEQTNEYSSVIEQAAENGDNLVEYSSRPLSQKLKIIANLISGGLGTRIYVVNQGGYDTHHNQVSGNDTTTGVHADLLEELSEAISTFQQDLKLLGIDDRVLGLAYSEFGRRIQSNGGNGTDHGDAGPMIVFGSKVNPGIIGVNPTIPEVVTSAQAVQMQFDFRQVYRNILEGWFCTLYTTIEDDILFANFNNIGVLEDPCVNLISHTSEEEEEPAEKLIKLYPNPVKDRLFIEAIKDFNEAHLFILAPTSEPVFDNENWDGQQLIIDTSRYPSGMYIVQAVVGRQVNTLKFVKIDR